MSDITMNTLIKKRDDILCNSIDGEEIMMSVERSKYFSLNPVGTEIWALASEEVSLKDVADSLMKKFDVKREQCERELIDFTDKLHKEGLISING